MTRIQFYKKVAKDNEIPQTSAKVICDAVFRALRECLEDPDIDHVFIKDLGVFRKKNRPSRKSYNTKTGELYKTKPRMSMQFFPCFEYASTIIGEDGQKVVIHSEPELN